MKIWAMEECLDRLEHQYSMEKDPDIKEVIAYLADVISIELGLGEEESDHDWDF